MEMTISFEDHIEKTIDDNLIEKVKTIGDVVVLLGGEGEAGIPAKLKPKPFGDAGHAA